MLLSGSSWLTFSSCQRPLCASSKPAVLQPTLHPQSPPSDHSQKRSAAPHLHLKVIFISVTSSKSLLPWKVTYTQVLDYSLRAIILPTTIAISKHLVIREFFLMLLLSHILLNTAFESVFFLKVFLSSFFLDDTLLH